MCPFIHLPIVHFNCPHMHSRLIESLAPQCKKISSTADLQHWHGHVNWQCSRTEHLAEQTWEQKQ